MKKWVATSLAVVAVGIIALLIWGPGKVFAPAHENSQRATNSSNNAASSSKRPLSFDKTANSINDPASLWVVVNKLRPLEPKTYVPTGLVVPNVPLRANITSNEKYMRPDSAAALEKMFTAATHAGINLNVQSGYRSYNFQVNLYNSYVRQSGQAAADTFSARPGYSEHQTGLAVDIGTTRDVCEVNQCFGNTPEGQWVAANAYLYGFIIRYPKGLDNVTGYEYEPWHLRYIGANLSTEMHKEGVKTLEQFFNLPAAPDYH